MLRVMFAPKAPNPRQHTYIGDPVLSGGLSREIVAHFTTRTDGVLAGADITEPGTYGDFEDGSKAFRFEGANYGQLTFLAADNLIIWQPSTQLIRGGGLVDEVTVFSPGLVNLTNPGSLLRLGWNAGDSWYDNGAAVPVELPGRSLFDVLDAKQGGSHFFRITVA